MAGDLAVRVGRLASLRDYNPVPKRLSEVPREAASLGDGEAVFLKGMDNLIVITGSMGTGKTTTLGEASDLLSEYNISHAAIDLDALGLAYLPGNSADLVLGNLQAVAANYAAAGIQRLIIAAAVESRANLNAIRDATGARAIVVCRLRAAQSVMEARVAARERGIHSRRYVARVRVLEELLDAAALEDFTITTTDATVTDNARELLTRAGWIAGMASSD